MALTRLAGKRRPALIGAAMAGAIALVMPNLSWAQSVTTDDSTAMYIVQVAGTPLAGYQGDVQILPTGATPMTKNLRLSPVRRIDAGESTNAPGPLHGRNVPRCRAFGSPLPRYM